MKHLKAKPVLAGVLSGTLRLGQIVGKIRELHRSSEIVLCGSSNKVRMRFSWSLRECFDSKQNLFCETFLTQARQGPMGRVFDYVMKPGYDQFV
ncbi:MAG TPA: hypothetical protein VHG11_00345 [Pseudorhizobium sp.]|nr:hypothetical protein [Pseudorhizobium sp.]